MPFDGFEKTGGKNFGARFQKSLFSVVPLVDTSPSPPVSALNHHPRYWSGNDVRIKLKIEDYNYIRDAKRIELDGRLFHVDSDARPHGLFDSIQFYTLFLRPIE